VRNPTRTYLLALFAALALFAGACGGGGGTESESESGAAGGDEGTSEESSASEEESASESEATSESESEASSESESSASAAELNTECQVELPSSGAGSAEGMAQDPVATAASNNPELSTLVSAVEAAGLTDTLNNLEGATVFAPSNDAFAKIPQETLDMVLADQELLTQILTYHVAPGEGLEAEGLIEEGPIATVQGEELTFDVAESGALEVAGQAESVCPNVMTANATVHIIDSVLMPPSMMEGSSESGSGAASESESSS